MKTYIVYADGFEVGIIKAGSHNSAEKKAIKKFGRGFLSIKNIQVVYTEE